MTNTRARWIAASLLLVAVTLWAQTAANPNQLIEGTGVGHTSEWRSPNGQVYIGDSTARHRPDPHSEQKFNRRYMLVTRGLVPTTMGCWSDSYDKGCGPVGVDPWQYTETFYPTFLEAVEALQRDCSAFAGTYEEFKKKVSRYACTVSGEENKKNNYDGQEFVGIYQVFEVAGPGDVKFAQGDKVTTHTVEEKEHWFDWMVMVDPEGKVKGMEGTK